MMIRVPLIKGPEIVEVSSRYSKPDRHVFYTEGVELKEDFTARIDWHEAKLVPPHELRWFVGSELVFKDRYCDPLCPTCPCPPSETVTHSFDVGCDPNDDECPFEVGAGLTVVAAAFATGQPPPPAEPIDWPSRPYRANFDVIAKVDAIPDGKLRANTSGDTLTYDMPDDDCTSLVLDEGASDVNPPSDNPDLPFFTGFPLSLTLGGVLSGSINDDGTISAGFSLPPDIRTDPAAEETEMGGSPFSPTGSGTMTWAYDGSWRVVLAQVMVGIDAAVKSPPLPIFATPPVYGTIAAGFSALVGLRLHFKSELESNVAIDATFLGFVEAALGIGVPHAGNVEGYVRGGAVIVFCSQGEFEPCLGDEACGGILEKIGLFLKAGLRGYLAGWRTVAPRHEIS